MEKSTLPGRWGQNEGFIYFWAKNPEFFSIENDKRS